MDDDSDTENEEHENECPHNGDDDLDRRRDALVALVDAVREVLTNRAFLDASENCRRTYESVQRGHDEAAKEARSGRETVVKDWNARVERLHWVRYVLSALVVGAIVFLGAEKILDGQQLLTLLLAVAGSLFVQPRQSEGNKAERK